MTWAAFVVLGGLVGSAVRLAAPGWRGATFSEVAAMVMVSVVGSVVAAIIASALPVASAFLAMEPAVFSGAIVGSISAIALLGSPARAHLRASTGIERA
ncbi:MAG: hypothetical protein ACT4TC_02885 [Myxococcaceae bacterium]